MEKVFIALCFFFFAKHFLTAAADPVLDVNGEPLLPGNSYYIVSAIRGGGGGGVTVPISFNGTCSTEIYQESLDLRRGLPANFLPKLRIGLVLQSSDLFIKFSAIPFCRDPHFSTEWKVNEVDQATGQEFLSLANEEEEASWFRIETLGLSSYKIVHCVASGTTCRDVGRYFGDASPPRLAINDGQPFMVTFVKADKKFAIDRRSIV